MFNVKNKFMGRRRGDLSFTDAFVYTICGSGIVGCILIIWNVA